jgi:predicted DNA-binding protein (UPF0251 family)
MSRPKVRRFLNFDPKIVHFKPQGVPLRELEEVILQSDEIEAIKLYHIDNLNQVEAAKMMKISQPTFARILDGAFKKVASALIVGKSILIEKK